MQDILAYLTSKDGPARGIPAVSVNSGTWYPDDASLRYWPLQDRVRLITATTSYNLFDLPMGKGGKTPSDTNLEASPVPGNEAWYLWGIKVMFQLERATPATSAERALLQQVIDGAYLTISVPQQENYRSTLWKFFGPMQFSQADPTPTLAESQPSAGVYEASEEWPVPLIYQANSVWKITLNLGTAVPAGITNLFNLGIEMPRVLAALVPA